MSLFKIAIEQRGKYWRDIIRRDKERNRFAEALKQRKILKEKEKWFSTERSLEKKKYIIREHLTSNNTQQEEKIRLARALGLMYNLDLSVPAPTRLITWRQEIRAKGIVSCKKRVKFQVRCRLV